MSTFLTGKTQSRTNHLTLYLRGTCPRTQRIRSRVLIQLPHPNPSRPKGWGVVTRRRVPYLLGKMTPARKQPEEVSLPLRTRCFRPRPLYAKSGITLSLASPLISRLQLAPMHCGRNSLPLRRPFQKPQLVARGLRFPRESNLHSQRMTRR